jgi:hypothetical protein
MRHEQQRSPLLSSSAKADDPVNAVVSGIRLEFGEYWVPRLRGA